MPRDHTTSSEGPTESGWGVAPPEAMQYLQAIDAITAEDPDDDDDAEITVGAGDDEISDETDDEPRMTGEERYDALMDTAPREFPTTEEGWNNVFEPQRAQPEPSQPPRQPTEQRKKVEPAPQQSPTRPPEQSQVVHETANRPQEPRGREVAETRSGQLETPHSAAEEVKGLTYDDVVLNERKVTFVGGTIEEKDEALRQVVLTHIERRLEQQDGPVVIVAANFTPGPSGLITNADPRWYRSVELQATEPMGPSALLSTEQNAIALAAAAGGENASARLAYRRILTSVGQGLEAKRTEDAEKDGTNPKPVTPQDLRDAMRILANEARTGTPWNEAPHIVSEEQVAVRGAITVTEAKRNEHYLAPLSQWLDAAIPDNGRMPAHRGTPSPNNNPALEGAYPTNNVTLVTLNANGYGDDLRMERDILSHSLLPLVAQRTQWGRPELLILTNVENAIPAALRELVEHCESQGIPIVATTRKVTTDVVEFMADGAVGVFQLSSFEAAPVSGVAGVTPRTVIQGGSANVGANEGASKHRGISQGYEFPGNGEPKNAGRSGSADTSGGMSYGNSQNVGYVDAAPRIPKHALDQQLRPGELLIIRSTPPPSSLEKPPTYTTYDSRSRRPIRHDFPPADEPKLLDPTEDIARIKANVERGQQAQLPDPRGQQPAVGGGQQRGIGGRQQDEQLQIEMPQAPVPPRRLESPAQERMRLQQHYNKDTGHSVMGGHGALLRKSDKLSGWPSWLLQEFGRQRPYDELRAAYEQRAASGKTTLEWRDWYNRQYIRWGQQRGVMDENGRIT
jgi:hypothetical protein